MTLSDQSAAIPCVASGRERDASGFTDHAAVRVVQANNPKKAALFYVDHLGFEITDEKTSMIRLHGQHINLFVERDPALGSHG
jgi:catechol 2,3-dioxygenase-like lactoylglutathione lyase family enzyme